MAFPEVSEQLHFLGTLAAFPNVSENLLVSSVPHNRANTAKVWVHFNKGQFSSLSTAIFSISQHAPVNIFQVKETKINL